MRKKINSLTELPKELKVCINDKEGWVKTEAYIIAKTQQLRDFGYNDLDTTTVEKQILAILNHKPKEELSVIGMFMLDEIKTEGD